LIEKKGFRPGGGGEILTLQKRTKRHGRKRGKEEKWSSLREKGYGNQSERGGDRAVQGYTALMRGGVGSSKRNKCKKAASGGNSRLKLEKKIKHDGKRRRDRGSLSFKDVPKTRRRGGGKPRGNLPMEKNGKEKKRKREKAERWDRA